VTERSDLTPIPPHVVVKRCPPRPAEDALGCGVDWHGASIVQRACDLQAAQRQARSISDRPRLRAEIAERRARHAVEVEKRREKARETNRRTAQWRRLTAAYDRALFEAIDAGYTSVSGPIAIPAPGESKRESARKRASKWRAANPEEARRQTRDAVRRHRECK
jgi:hypothetical protein